MSTVAQDWRIVCTTVPEYDIALAQVLAYEARNIPPLIQNKVENPETLTITFNLLVPVVFS